MMVAVVIVNWNQAADTVVCARAVQAWPLAAAHIWVVDNASSGDDVERIQRDCPGVHLLRSPENRGFAGGNNLALAEIVSQNYQAVLLLNNDASIDGDSLASLCAVLDAHSEIGVVGPVLWDASTPPPGRILSTGGRDIAHHVTSHLQTPLSAGQTREVDYVPGTCVLIRIDVLRALGLMDEAFFFSGEVAAFCREAWQHGYRCSIDGNARANHALHRSAGARGGLHAYYVIRNRFLFIHKFYRRQQGWLWGYWILIAAYNSLSALVHGDLRRAKATALGCVDGLMGRFGGQNARVLRFIGAAIAAEQRAGE